MMAMVRMFHPQLQVRMTVNTLECACRWCRWCWIDTLQVAPSVLQPVGHVVNLLLLLQLLTLLLQLLLLLELFERNAVHVPHVGIYMLPMGWLLPAELLLHLPKKLSAILLATPIFTLTRVGSPARKQSSCEKGGGGLHGLSLLRRCPLIAGPQHRRAHLMERAEFCSQCPAVIRRRRRAPSVDHCNCVITSSQMPDGPLVCSGINWRTVLGELICISPP
jgi:hypothetical protein